MTTSLQLLSGPWRLATDPSNQGRVEEWYRRGPVPAALPTDVPGIIQQTFPAYHGVVWYWLSFVPLVSAEPSERYHLRFGAVDYLADVWLNGTYLGGHEGGETPFTLDATTAVWPSRENVLVVRVLNPGEEPIDGFVLKETPHRNKTGRGWRPGQGFNSGGILLPVEVVVTPRVWVADLFARPDPLTGQVRLSITIQNAGATAAPGSLRATITASASAEALDRLEGAVEFPPGESVVERSLTVAQPRLWSLDDPHLYRVAVAVEATAGVSSSVHQHAVRCGFRDFRVENGYFRLNGKRVFVRSTHTGNHVPIGQIVSSDTDFLRRDLLYAKAAGFNMVRFISGMAYPEQLDLCDELGLMVQEECLAGWLLADSPRMTERFDRSVREMVLRDRNHPSITIWGMLNETWDGPVFRQAVADLSLVRTLDDSRLVLLSSGRWDGQWQIGSASNPGSAAWEHVWGAEGPEARSISSSTAPPNWDPPAYLVGAGDVHAYPQVPQTAATNAFLRGLGQTGKPIFLTEYGIGSLMNVVSELRHFEQVGARPDLLDQTAIRTYVEQLEADWHRFGFDGVYPFVEDLLRESQRLHARQRLLGFDLIRSNPRICGYNLTGMLDHAITGEGLWTFWREWKPGIVDALADGWAPLRWCLFVTPGHGYTGRSVMLEAVLANEDVLAPGAYPVRFRVSGPGGIVWERRAVISIPETGPGQDGPLAVPVLKEEVTLDGPAGAYVFAASCERGAAPSGGRLTFYLSDEPRSVRSSRVALWGVDATADGWLRSRGVETQPFGALSTAERSIILVGEPDEATDNLSSWRELATQVARGSVAVFLTPLAFRRGPDPVGWLPLATKGRCYRFNNWLYHKEDVAKRHPIFAGLPAGGILDWDFYDQVIPQYLFEGQDAPDEVIAASFAPAYSCPEGYASGVVLGSYRLGEGRFVLNALRILENLGANPAADRLLLNLIEQAAPDAAAPPSPLPNDFESLLATIGFVPTVTDIPYH